MDPASRPARRQPCAGHFERREKLDLVLIGQGAELRARLRPARRPGQAPRACHLSPVRSRKKSGNPRRIEQGRHVRSAPENNTVILARSARRRPPRRNGGPGLSDPTTVQPDGPDSTRPITNTSSARGLERGFHRLRFVLAPPLRPCRCRSSESPRHFGRLDRTLCPQERHDRGCGQASASMRCRPSNVLVQRS